MAAGGTKKAANLLKVGGYFFKRGRGDRTRTCDSLVPNQERYQLRYTSIFVLRLQRYTFFVTLANFSAIILLDNALFDKNLLQSLH